MEKKIIIGLISLGVTSALGAKLLDVTGQGGKAQMMDVVTTSVFGLTVVGFAAKFIHGLAGL